MKENKEDYVIDGKWIYIKSMPSRQYYLPNLLYIEIYNTYYMGMNICIKFSNNIDIVIKNIFFDRQSYKEKEKAYNLALNYVEQFKKKIKNII